MGRWEGRGSTLGIGVCAPNPLILQTEWEVRCGISPRCRSPAAPVGRKGGSCGCEFLIMVGLRARPAVAKGGRNSATVVKMPWEEGRDELGARRCRGCACVQLC